MSDIEDIVASYALLNGLGVETNEANMQFVQKHLDNEYRKGKREVEERMINGFARLLVDKGNMYAYDFPRDEFHFRIVSECIPEQLRSSLKR